MTMASFLTKLKAAADDIIRATTL